MWPSRSISNKLAINLITKLGSRICFPVTSPLSSHGSKRLSSNEARYVTYLFIRLSVRSVVLEFTFDERNFRFSETYNLNKTQPGLAAKNSTLEPMAGNRTCIFRYCSPLDLKRF